MSNKFETITREDVRRTARQVIMTARKQKRIKHMAPISISDLMKSITAATGEQVSVTYLKERAREVGVILASPPRTGRKKGVFITTLVSQGVPDQTEEMLFASGSLAGHAVAEGRAKVVATNIAQIANDMVARKLIGPARINRLAIAAFPPPPLMLAPFIPVEVAAQLEQARVEDQTKEGGK